MHRFKFQPPQQHRRSLHHSKNEQVVFLNTLDKCSQILRQDRLFVRNQIKNNNQEIINIFKQYPRSTQLSALQVKLRKHVQNVKNRIKNQQLSKFKQNLKQNHNPFVALPKKTNNYVRNSLQHTMFKPHQSLELHRTMNRPNRSQEHQGYDMNSSLRQFQNMLKYKFNQDVIEERQSQNVTSARQNRPQYQTNKPRPLEDKTMNPNLNNSKSMTSVLQAVFNSSKSMHNSQKQAKNASKPGPWCFEEKAKQKMYQFKKNNFEITQQDQPFAKSKTFEACVDDRDEQSIFDLHLNEPNQVPSDNPLENNKFQPNNTLYFSKPSQPNPFKIDKKTPTIQLSENLSYKPKQFTLQQIQPNPIQTPANSSLRSSLKGDQTIFTPQQLLTQCRKFLRYRDGLTNSNLFEPMQTWKATNGSINFGDNNSLEIRQVNNIVDYNSSSIKKEDSGFEYPSIKQSQSKNNQNVYTHFQTFANVNDYKSNQLPAIVLPVLPSISAPKTTSPTPMFASPGQQTPIVPPLNLSNHIPTILPSPLSLPVHNIPQVIPAVSNNLSTTFPTNFLPSSPFSNNPLPTFPTSKQQPQPKKIILPSNISIQQFVEDLMQIADMNPFIIVSDLKNYICNRNDSLQLSSVLHSFLQFPYNKQVCIPNIAQTLQISYSQTVKKYPHLDKAVNSVYDLLDIDQKGYINNEDIDSFLRQIEDAQIDNFNQVSSQLRDLFGGADFNNQERLSYWNFYLVKNSDQFLKVSELLGEFQFEIERDS